MRTWLSMVAVVGVCLVVAGCNRTLADPRVLVGEKSDFGMTALARGKVQLVGGCFGMVDFVIVWPHGTRLVDRDPLTIAVPGAGRVRVGQQISLGGGFVVEHSDPGEVPNPLRVAGLTVPKSCAKYDVFLAAPDQE